MKQSKLDCYNSHDSYLLVGVLRAVNTNDLSGCLVSLIAVLNEFLLEARIVLDVCRLVNSTLDFTGC